MKSCNISDVSELVKKTASRMGMKEPDNEFCKAVWQHCAKHGLETIRDSMISFERKELKYFPKLGEIISKVRQISDYDEKFSPSDGRCKYHDFNESDLSKKLCKKNVSADEATVSNLMFEKVLCAWHSQVERGKINPQSTDAKFVALHLRNLAKFEESGDSIGQNPSKSSRKGLIDSAFKNINTNARGVVENGREGQ